MLVVLVCVVIGMGTGFRTIADLPDTRANTAYANVTVTGGVDADSVRKVAQPVGDSRLTVETGGHACAPTTKAGGISEVVGIVAASHEPNGSPPAARKAHAAPSDMDTES